MPRIQILIRMQRSPFVMFQSRMTEHVLFVLARVGAESAEELRRLAALQPQMSRQVLLAHVSLTARHTDMLFLHNCQQAVESIRQLTIVVPNMLTFSVINLAHFLPLLRIIPCYINRF